MTRSLLAVACIAFISAGCTATSKRADLGKVFSDEGVVLGKINVIYNGANRGAIEGNDTGCSFTFKREDFSPTYDFPLDKDGYFFVTLPKGNYVFHGIACVDKSVQYYYPQGIKFTNAGGQEKTYIGDITFDWKTRGGLKVSAAFGIIGAIADAASSDGTATVKVEDRQAEALKAFDAYVKAKGYEDKLRARRGIASVAK
jgi:hypothetical protein